MRTIALLINNEQEKTVLEHYFQSLGYKVLALKSSFATFRTILDAHPLCVICEMPQKFLDHMYVVRLLNNQKKTENIPVIAYGNHTATAIIRSFYESGVELYYQRPLQIKMLLEDIEYIKDGTSIKIKRYRNNVDTRSTSSSSSQNKNQDPNQQVQRNQNAPEHSVKESENTLTVASDELDAVEQLMNPETSPNERVGIIIGRVREMLAFPFTIVKILDITQNDQTGAVDLAKAIEADPVIVSSLLSISNTVYYARQGKRISNVQEAIVRLGFVETKNIALSLSVMSMFSHDTKSEGFNRFEFWYHSLACGILSEILARKAGFPNPERAFICGLLHDFGIILLDEFFNGFFTSVYGQVVKNKSCFITEEKRLWGMSHNSAVAQLFRGWNMPQDIITAMSQLDQFGSKLAPDPGNKEQLLVNIIGFSNLIVKSLQLGKDCDDIIYPVHRTILFALNCQNGIEDELLSRCMERLNVYTDFFNLEKRNFKYPPEKKPDARPISIIEHTKEMFFPHNYYLSMCGYVIDVPVNVNKEQLIEKRPEAILNLINSSIPEKYLEPFVNLPQTAQNGKSEQFIPAIFISMDKLPDLNLKSLSNTYCMPAAVNMQVLSSIVENMIARQNIKVYDELTGQSELSGPQDKILSVNYLNDQTVLVILKGVIRLYHFNEIRSCLVKMLEQKIPCIAVQLNDIVDIDNLMSNLLVNFQKKTAEEGYSLCFCCIGKEIPSVIQNSDTLKSIHYFTREHELVTHFNRHAFNEVSA